MREAISLYAPGTPSIGEDFHYSMVLKANDGGYRRVHLVGDGASEPNWPGKPQRLFNGRTAGKVIGDVILQAFMTANPEQSLKDMIGYANERVGHLWRTSYNLPLDNAEDLGETSLTVADVTDNEVQIVSIGDCMTLWKLRNGEHGGTRNQLLEHDTQMYQEIDSAFREDDETITGMWKIFGPRLARYRHERVNTGHPKGYGKLNGQPQAVNFLEERVLPSSEIENLLLSSDGLFDLDQTSDSQELARSFFEHYQQLKHLEAILEERRRQEDEKKGSHIYGDHAEATAILIPFAR